MNIKRVKENEQKLDKIINTFNDLELALDNFEDIDKIYEEINAYYGSKEWFKDREDYELNNNIKAGVLSEDGIWNIIEKRNEIIERIKDISNNKQNMNRCNWCNLKNPKYIEYHDKEWGVPRFDDRYLLEMLILESFQAGLSWECILNKRESFKQSYDNFDINKIIKYDDKKIIELINNKDIVRNKLKIKASINNAKIFKSIINEYGNFYNYLKLFTKDKIIYEIGNTTNKLSDTISNDLQNRGMKFVGSTIIYSYLQAIGIINSHDKECFKYKK